MDRIFSWRTGYPASVVLLVAALQSCDHVNPVGFPGSTDSLETLPLLSCLVNESNVFLGGPGRDGIPALVNPTLVAVDHESVKYISRYQAAAASDPDSPDARVVGLVVDGVPVAIPHNIMWWHEVVNIDIGGRRVAVTYCPLTGSALAFDASAAGVERFGVSGLIFQNNLVMFDPETESLWPQMCRASEFGARAGFALQAVPVVDMLWEAWVRDNPATVVVSEDNGFNFEYDRYPYLAYETSDHVLFAMPYAPDLRVRAKERVLGIIDRTGGVALPFSELGNTGILASINVDVNGESVQVLWDAVADGAMPFHTVSDAGTPANIRVTEGRLMDTETGSVWTVDGRAIRGPRTGERLIHFADGYVAYWFAWASFHPRTRVWRSE